MTEELRLDPVVTPAVATVDVPAVAGRPGKSGETDRLGRRNDRILVGGLVAYISLLSALMLVRGVSITPDVLLVALGLAAVVIGRGRLFLRDWIPFIGLFFAYELMRGYADDFGVAVHVTDILAIERAIFGGSLPTEILQHALHPAVGVDLLASVATIFYFLHFPLPIAVAFFLWLRRRRVYYDFVAAMIILSMAAFMTYLVLPVAPPWWAASHGLLPGPDGQPAIIYLKQLGFDQLAHAFGFEGRYLFSYAFYDINPNQVAAFPSLHAGYPFLAFLFARRAFGRVGWLMLAYAVCVWFSVVYLADHYVVDVLGGIAFASVTYWVVMHAPRWFRRAIDEAADAELEAGVEADEAGGDGALLRLGRRVRWALVGQGLAVMAAGVALAVALSAGGWLGGTTTPFYLVPWLAIIGGLWRAAVGLLSR